MTQRGDPRLNNHPMQRRSDWESNAVPIAIHGDAVPVLQVGKAGSKSYDVYSFQSLLVSGPTVSIKLLMFGMWVTSADDETWKEVWRTLTWSLHWLFMGRWPPVDWNGAAWGDDHPTEKRMANQPLAGGYSVWCTR